MAEEVSPELSWGRRAVRWIIRPFQVWAQLGQRPFEWLDRLRERDPYLHIAVHALIISVVTGLCAWVELDTRFVIFSRTNGPITGPGRLLMGVVLLCVSLGCAVFGIFYLRQRRPKGPHRDR